MPRAVVDAAVGEHLAVVGELEFATHESIGELAGLDRERADVAGDLLTLALLDPAAEHHLEHAAARSRPCGQKIKPTRCGVMVSGAGSGAASENITPVMSIRVDGPGAWRISKFSTNRAETICIGEAMAPGG